MSIERGLKAIFREDDVNAEWYKKRLETCLSCEFNTINGAEMPTLRDKVAYQTLKAIKPIINNEQNSTGNCSICKCYINKKVGDKLEGCPLGKWGSLSASSKGLEIIAGDGVEFVGDGENMMEIHLGNIPKNSIHKTIVRTKFRTKNLTRVDFTCSCAMVDGKIERDEKGYYNIPIILSTATKPRKDDQNVKMVLDYIGSRTAIEIKFNVK